MQNIHPRYGKKGTLKPCRLNKDDLLVLTDIIQETFTKPEIERYFSISSTIGGVRVFAKSIDDLLDQKELPDRLTDLAFWIESLDNNGFLNKSILLDFSKFAVQLSVEGADSGWVNKKYSEITHYLKTKTAWYWPLIILERFIIFAITLILISSLVISLGLKERFYYIDEALLVGLWIFFVFFDTRNLWPFANIRLKDDFSPANKENLVAALIIFMLTVAIMGGTISPILKIAAK